MYENEKNLYNYTYRKSGRDVEEGVYYTNPVEPVPTDEVKDEFEYEKPRRRKHKGSALKIACLALCFALIGGSVGAGVVWMAMDGNTTAGNTTAVAVSDRVVAEVTQTSVTGTSLLTDSQVYAANVDSVVSINTTATTNYFGQAVEVASAGSGFIITTDGYIVTNYHVVEDSTAVSITLNDNSQYEATVIGYDEDYDLAVLKIDATGLQAVTLGDSDSLSVGDRVLAIGNPLGELTFSMSGGMVSSVNRAINVSGTPFNMIQTDAAINPGNSGGPLFNSYGEVVGIVSAKYSADSSGNSVEGLGFAIPMNDVKVMIEDIITNGYVTNKPYLAVTAGSINDSMSAQMGLPVGLYLYTVEEGGAANLAGLQTGDVITKVGDVDITSLEDFSSAKRSYVSGDVATFEFYRDGVLMSTEVTWDAVPQQVEEVEETAEIQVPQTPSNSSGNSGSSDNSGNDYDDYYNYFSPFGGMFDSYFGR
ncbi:trypsin-like peptidase domain-containing protein [Bengtsoniella intestinalis]|uniref:S1C family serine protease n=1 Tax=Bengtsoniella intestinalis TaxID=3073143 RepID=UPI00391F9BBA